MRCFFRRSDVARLRPDLSVAARLDPRQHFLKDGGQDFYGWYVTLLVGAVGKTVFLEGTTRAALALFFHSIHWGRWLSCLPAKYTAPISFVSMQIPPWGKSFFTSKRASLFPFPYFFPSRLSSLASLRLPPPPGPATVVSFGDFIEKVGGRII